MIYAVIISIFFFVWVLVSAILFLFLCKEKPIDKIKFYDENYKLKEKYENNKKNKFSLLKLLSSLIPNIKFNKRKVKELELELMKADIPITIEELLVIKIILSLTLAFLGYAASRSSIFALLILIIGWNIPTVVISSKKKERIKLFDQQLTEGITIISNSLKAGHSFLQAISVVTGETKDPFSKEFKKLLKEMSLGISEEDALNNLLTRMESEDLRLLMNAILIQKDIGGNLSEILDNISETIRERQKIKNELRTLTAQGKLSGVIVMLIPIILGILIYLLNKEQMLLLFTTKIGLAMIMISVISEIIGFFMIKKITNIDM